MADLGNTSVFSQTDASNGSGTMPSWLGSAPPSTLDDAGRALQGAVTREWNWRSYTLTASGTNTKTLTYSTAPAAYYNGQRFAFLNGTAITGSTTLNVNSLGAKTIKKVVSGSLANLTAGDLPAGVFAEVAYNSSNDCFVLVNAGIKYFANVKEFGAVGDGVTNDTTAIQAAINFAIANNKSLYIPAGTYLATGLTYSSSSAHCSIIGDGSGLTIIKCPSGSSSTVLTISGSPNQLFVSGIQFSGNGTITSWGTGDGVAGNNQVGTLPTTGASVTLVDLVHSTFVDCYFTNSVWGADIRGGITNTFISCFAYYNSAIGYRVYKATFAPTSGYPNATCFRDCVAKENGEVGLYYDDGRDLIVDGGNFEGNGKNTTVATSIGCAIYVGSNTGAENGASSGPDGTPNHALAATISRVWFEQNGNNDGSGVPNSNDMAHIVHRHGFLRVTACLFTNSTGGRVLRIDGGQYQIENCSFDSALTVPTNNVDEGMTSGNSDLLNNNFINNCYGNTATLTSKLTAADCTIDPTKTYFDFQRYTPVKTLSGSDTTSSGTLTITWAAGTWLTTPSVVAQVVTNDNTSKTYTAEVYGVSTTGATIRAKQNSGGTVTQPALTVTWIAVGT